MYNNYIFDKRQFLHWYYSAFQQNFPAYLLETARYKYRKYPTK